MEESLKALGASGDSETSGPQPADEGFFAFLRSLLFPKPPTSGEAAQATMTPGRRLPGMVAASVAALVKRGDATAITIEPSPGGKKQAAGKGGLMAFFGGGGGAKAAAEAAEAAEAGGKKGKKEKREVRVVGVRLIVLLDTIDILFVCLKRRKSLPSLANN